MQHFIITKEDIPEDMDWLCDIIGVKCFMEIVDRAGGELLYIPKRTTIEIPLRKKAIMEEFDGSNARILGRKYGLTERRVREILKEASK